MFSKWFLPFKDFDEKLCNSQKFFVEIPCVLHTPKTVTVFSGRTQFAFCFLPLLPLNKQN